MKKGFARIYGILFLIFLPLILTPQYSWGTNGNNLLGIGPIARALGGTGVAAPQDTISAIFANPAATCFVDHCPGSESEFSITFFDPSVETGISVKSPRGDKSFQAESRSDPSIIPAFGITTPLSPRLRFALGAFGISGMGVDYRGSGIDLDQNPANGYEGDIFTQLEVIKVSPNIAWLIRDNFSLGLSLQAISGNLDMGSGSSRGYAYGVQFGALYKKETFRFGLSYTSPQKVRHEEVADFDQDGVPDDLELETPQNFNFGIAFIPHKKLLIETDIRWFNWEDAAGYGDFDWDDQWAFIIGTQYQPVPGLFLRAGYNYGENPVRENNGWNPAALRNIQGKNIPAMQFELLRLVGFPAISKHHLTMGLGYHFSEAFALDISYMHAFRSTIRERSAGDTVVLRSELSENTLTLGLTWRF